MVRCARQRGRIGTLTSAVLRVAEGDPHQGPGRAADKPGLEPSSAGDGSEADPCARPPFNVRERRYPLGNAASGDGPFQPHAPLPVSTCISRRTGIVEGITLTLLADDRAGRLLRLHQRLPRHRERDRDVGRHEGPPAAVRACSWRPRSTSSARSPARPSPRRSAPASSTTPDHDQAIVAASLIGAIIWNLITWWLGLPSSSSHALIGGLLGATIVAGGCRRAQPAGHLEQGHHPAVHVARSSGFAHRVRADGRC